MIPTRARKQRKKLWAVRMRNAIQWNYLEKKKRKKHCSLTLVGWLKNGLKLLNLSCIS